MKRLRNEMSARDKVMKLFRDKEKALKRKEKISVELNDFGKQREEIAK